MTEPVCLLTRPQAQSEDFAAGLAGIDYLISPILKIVPLPFDSTAIAEAPGLVFTSANAVAFAGPGQGRLALCVGPQTGEAARQAGFEVTTGPGDAEGLMPLLDIRRDWLHLHGRHLARELPLAGIEVYDQQALPLNAAADAALAGSRPVILPLFSRRSAGILSDAVRDARAAIGIVAISEAVESAYSGPADARIVAAQPDRAGMVATIRMLSQTERSRPTWVEAERGAR
ncbi:uroporphyrinogen-III synthase [Paracoccus aerodenitrificans]|uniref:uroporphyrinogen-III synthase n=1 Tax=Paracoccus aerodenitrificans TaxID=3017781 RepID=UPI0022EFFB0D|nr:uroporphyrinogen-III synthase [Paracoccus aerodenitrificans]WBU64528.1 uroporphyrinogen-III synthase [Paracoccus aerodenitrificans]